MLCFAATNLAKGMHPYPIEQSVCSVVVALSTEPYALSSTRIVSSQYCSLSVPMLGTSVSTRPLIRGVGLGFTAVSADRSPRSRSACSNAPHSAAAVDIDSPTATTDSYPAAAATKARELLGKLLASRDDVERLDWLEARARETELELERLRHARDRATAVFYNLHRLGSHNRRP